MVVDGSRGAGGVALIRSEGTELNPGGARRTESIRAASSHWKLTARQTEVLDLVARGLTNVLIAEILRIGEGTVEFHVSALFDKAGVSNRATLIARLLEF